MANLGTLGIPGSELVGLPGGAGGGWFISMWSGSTASVPNGWQLCDGTGGLPDLRDRFIVGAGNTYAVGTTGGATTKTPSATFDPLSPHSHTINSITGPPSVEGGVAVALVSNWTNTSDSGGTPSATFDPLSILPPYYALCFIAYIGQGSV